MPAYHIVADVKAVTLMYVAYVAAVRESAHVLVFNLLCLSLLQTQSRSVRK
jgi:hypothetical protein